MTLTANLPIDLSTELPRRAGDVTLPLNVRAAAEFLHRRLARVRLEHFATYTKRDYEVNWHHRSICRHLDLWAEKKIKRLMIFCPPRTGKSELASRRLPAHIFGRYPDANIIACSYNASLATQMNRDVQRIMDDESYRLLFPETSLSGKNIKTTALGNWLRNSEAFEIIKRRGIYYCAGVGGGITGRGFHYGIIDDPVKSRAEAESEAVSNGVWEWYINDFYTRRMDDDACILVMLTRWHMNDLAGRLLKQAQEDPNLPQWTVLKFPAVCVEPKHPEDPRGEGEPLWPSRFPLSALDETRRVSGSYAWSSVHQQEPNPRGGTIFTTAYFRYFRVDRRPVELRGPDGKPYSVSKDHFVLEDTRDDGAIRSRAFPFDRCRWFQVVDTASTVSDTADYTVVGTFVLTPDRDLLVWDIFREQIEVPVLYSRVTAERAKPPCPVVFQAVEGKDSGIGLIQNGAARGRPFRELQPWGNKLVRAATASQWYETGRVWHRAGADWLAAFETELTTFPTAAHDDQVDSLTYAAQLAVEDVILNAPVDGVLTMHPTPETAAPPPDGSRSFDVGGTRVDFDEPDAGRWWDRR